MRLKLTDLSDHELQVRAAVARTIFERTGRLESPGPDDDLFAARLLSETDLGHLLLVLQEQLDVTIDTPPTPVTWRSIRAIARHVPAAGD